MNKTMAKPLTLLVLLVVLVSFLSLEGCSSSASSPVTEISATAATSSIADEATTIPTETPPEPGDSVDLASQRSEFDADNETIVTAQTNFRPDGNRIVDGVGNIPAQAPIDIALEGEPVWVLALPSGEGMLWAVVLEDGRTQAFVVRNGRVETYAITPAQIPAGMPPLLQLEKGAARIVVPANDVSPLTHPVFFNERGDMAYIDTKGNLVVRQEDTTTVLPVNAQADARILVDENGRLLLYTDPTDEYGHGIMGDKVEAGSLTLVATQPAPGAIRTIPVSDDGYVLEGIAPIWVDLDRDGAREIIVTRSNSDDGAQIVVLNEMGDLVATGPAIGLGGRWRHQLAAGPFGPDGEMELVDVLTPHIGGPTEFFQWRDGNLVLVTSVDGYTSHVIGSRNLDMAVAGQFDQSGRLTVLLPNQARTALGAIQHGSDGAEVAWTLPLSGTLVTNIAASTLADDRLAVGVGQDNNTLRVWQEP